MPSLYVSTLQQPSSSWSLPDTSCAPFPTRSPQRSSANAAVGGLTSPPVGRRRRAYLHLPRSTASRSSTYHLLPSASVAHHFAYLRVGECPVTWPSSPVWTAFPSSVAGRDSGDYYRDSVAVAL